MVGLREIADRVKHALSGFLEVQQDDAGDGGEDGKDYGRDSLCVIKFQSLK